MNADGKGRAAPLISVVIPTLNVEDLIDGALASLAQQRWRDFELVVADGASTDATLARIAAYQARLPALQVLSARDGGVYEAINRGISAARGQWLYVLGSDDRVAGPDTLGQAAELLADASEDFVYGDVRMCGPNAFVPVGGRYSGALTLERLTCTNICQQAIFYRRSLVDRLGPFVTRYRISADWEYALRAFVQARVRWLDLVVCDYASTGISAKKADEPFMRDLPGLLVRAVLRQPLNAQLLPLRWRLREMAQQLRAQGRAGIGVQLWLAAAWLTLAARLQPASAKAAAA
jgi:glycosyltransferase involved in cell wall biosynthesis